SVTKAFTEACVHIQAERGHVSYDAPIAQYWPAFGQQGKDDITVRDVLTHRSGLPHLPEGSGAKELADWDLMCEAIALQKPSFPPGTKSTYQARNLGWILGQVVAETDSSDRDFSTFLAD